MSKIIDAVDLDQATDFNHAVAIIHGKIKQLVSDKLSAGKQSPDTLLIGKSPTKSLTRRWYKLRQKGYYEMIVVAVVDETTANRLLNCTPDSCSLLLSEALAEFTDYGEGVLVSRQSRGSAVVTESKVSLFVCLGLKANLFFKSPKRLKIDGSLLQGDDTAEDFDIADLLCDPDSEEEESSTPSSITQPVVTVSGLERPVTQPRCVVAHVIASTCTTTKPRLSEATTNHSLPITSVSTVSTKPAAATVFTSTRPITFKNLIPTHAFASPLTFVNKQKSTRKRTQDASSSFTESTSHASSQAHSTSRIIPTTAGHSNEESSPPQKDSSIERSNLNVDEFMLEAKAKQNLLLSLWKVHFNRTVFSSHMDELDFNTATLTNKLSTEMLCSLATRVVQQLGKEKGVRTIECLTLPCASLSFMQIASLKIAGVVLSTLHIKQFVIPFVIGDIPNDRVLMFSVIAVAENLTNCHPRCLKFVCSEKCTTQLGCIGILKEKLANALIKKGWNPKITYCLATDDGSETTVTLTDPPYSSLT